MRDIKLEKVQVDVTVRENVSLPPSAVQARVDALLATLTPSGLYTEAQADAFGEVVIGEIEKRMGRGPALTFESMPCAGVAPRKPEGDG